MRVNVSQVGRARTIRWLLYAVAAVLLVQISAPVRAFAEGDGDAADGSEAGACMEKAWADYNACLMSTPFEWDKRICDVEFAAATYACISEKAGDIWCKLRRTCLDDAADEYGDESWYEY